MKHFILTFSVALLFLSTSFVWGQNLLQNPGFESWTGDSICDWWVKETGGFDAVKESGIVHSGSFSAKLIIRNTSLQRFTQYVAPVNSGNNYEGSFYCFDNDQKGRARLYIRWFDGSGNQIGSFWSGFSDDSTGWQELATGSSAAPALAETAHVEIRLYNVSDTSVIYVDDASFVDLGGWVSETPLFQEGFSFEVFPTVSTKSVHINLTINKTTNTNISIYNITGRKIITLLSENLKKGKHTITWNGKTASGKSVLSGIYFVKLQMEGKTVTMKVSLLSKRTKRN